VIIETTLADWTAANHSFLLSLAGLLSGTGFGWFLNASIVAAFGKRG